MGFVYLLCDGVHFKIGMTKKDIRKRISELQTGNPNEIYISSFYKTECPYKVEQMMHVKYGTAKVKNEWFALTNEQVIKFKDNCANCEKIIMSLKDNPFVKIC